MLRKRRLHFKRTKFETNRFLQVRTGLAVFSDRAEVASVLTTHAPFKATMSRVIEPALRARYLSRSIDSSQQFSILFFDMQSKARISELVGGLRGRCVPSDREGGPAGADQFHVPGRLGPVPQISADYRDSASALRQSRRPADWDTCWPVPGADAQYRELLPTRSVQSERLQRRPFGRWHQALAEPPLQR
jgi:hypothetical protein